MRLPSEGGEEDAAALALDQRPTERCLQFANLERERRLRDVNALRRAAEGAVLDQCLKVS